MTFADKLSILYTQNKYTQEDFAECIGVSRSTLQEYLEGRSLPKLNIARNIAKTLGVSLDYLFLADEYIENDTGSDISPDELDTEIYKKLYNLYRNADKQTILQVEAFMDFLLTQNTHSKKK